MLGVDPGTRVAGYGVLDVHAGKRAEYVAAGPIRLPTDQDSPERLRCLHDRLLEVVAAHEPDALAVETVFHGKSFESVLRVGEARGVVLLLGANLGLDVQQFAPAMIKKTATGNGRASKAQVQSMITRVLSLPEAPEPVDVSDALAIAFCYGQRVWRDRLGSKKSSKLDEWARQTRTERRRRFQALVAKAEVKKSRGS